MHSVSFILLMLNGLHSLRVMEVFISVLQQISAGNQVAQRVIFLKSEGDLGEGRHNLRVTKTIFTKFGM